MPASLRFCIEYHTEQVKPPRAVGGNHRLPASIIAHLQRRPNNHNQRGSSDKEGGLGVEGVFVICTSLYVFFWGGMVVLDMVSYYGFPSRRGVDDRTVFGA
ncbi:hypothetical protein BO99DRAFT_208159 [Aspergillus violaceofuscus CBS 115571]|uniref:Uncharacterized protein n=1 Tax=Aspergillus violaceofuscus (strain CBS 115571) TaxID=1450538 RepID=A0A2V5IBT7_ASPV1|nr:hypothetical protein BO99DRAFT_208159 [Aspergillus violaceofuscus CBS 115571]